MSPDTARPPYHFDADKWTYLAHVLPVQRIQEQALLKQFAEDMWELEILRGMIAEVPPDSPLADKVYEMTAACERQTRQYEVWTNEVRERLRWIDDTLLNMPCQEH